MSDDKPCPECQKVIEEGDTFCRWCGYLLADEEPCPECQKPVGREDAFCRWCGCSFDDEAETGYVYHCMSSKTVQGIADELNKRDQEGWEYVMAFWGGSGSFGGNEYGVVVRRPRSEEEEED
jgi:hypothetical protein